MKTTPLQLDRVLFQAQLQKYVAAFGVVCGAQYAADGLSFDQARAKYAEHLAAVEAAKPAPPKALGNALGRRLAGFAAGLKLPGQLS